MAGKNCSTEPLLAWNAEDIDDVLNYLQVAEASIASVCQPGDKTVSGRSRIIDAVRHAVARLAAAGT